VPDARSDARAEKVACGSCQESLDPHTPAALCAACLIRAALTPDAGLEPGDHVAGYEILEGPFAGGMGQVYRAHKVGAPPALQVALKMMSVAELENPARRALFEQEIETLSKLQHPGIVRIYDTGEHEGKLFFTMEFVSGGTLAEQFERFRRPEAAARLVQRIARAVDYGHTRRLLHLDLTPSNILIDSEGRPHVADFGVSSVLGTSVRYGGTPEYMAPEQLPDDGRPLSTGCDVYALGAILYQLLTGSPPFEARSTIELRAQIARKRPASLREVAPGVDRDLAAICHCCLELDPEARYRSAVELADDLGRWLRREPVNARPHPSWRRAKHLIRRHPFASAGAAWTLLALAALGMALDGSLRQLRQDLVSTTLRANAYTARHAAGNALRVLEGYGEQLERFAAQDRLKQQVTDPDAKDAVLEPYCSSTFDSMGFYTPEGERTLRWPRVEARAYARDFPWRDYFRGARAAAAVGCRAPYVARSIRSEGDDKHKLILSVPVCEDGRWLGVLMATVDSSSSIGTVRLDDARSKGARGTLLGLRDRSRAEAASPAPEEFRVLVHEGLQQGDSARVDANFGRRLYTAWGPPRAAAVQLADRPGPISLTEQDYRDPVAGFEGRWLAGAAPVGGTGLVVVVQTRYDDVVAPGEAMSSRVLELMLLATAVMAVLISAPAWIARLRRERAA